MNTDAVFARFAEDGLMGGMRGHFPPDVALRTVEALYSEGIRLFEFTMNSVEPIAAMQAVKRQYGDAVCCGMGTVLDVEMAHRALDSGADFIVSPAFSPAVVKLVMGHDVLIAPGVITPTECVDAWNLGVRLLKLFPIGPLGLDYFKAVYGPLDHMQFLVNGGITPQSTRDFIRAGALVSGASGWLTGDGTWSAEKLRDRARQLRLAVAEGRGQGTGLHMV